MGDLGAGAVLPLYVQLADRLLEQIRAGDYGVGERIPSEHSLASNFGVGRPTVRQATESLVRRGYLSRRRGAGTFVRERAPHVDLFSLGGTLESFTRQGLSLETRLLESASRVRVDPNADQPLAGRRAYRLARIGSLAGEPVLLERIWFDAAVFPGLDQADLAGRSLSEFVSTRYRMEPHQGEQRFRVHALDATAALHLQRPPGDPVLRVDRTLHFPTASAAVFAEMDCRTDRITFSQQIGGNHA